MEAQCWPGSLSNPCSMGALAKCSMADCCSRATPSGKSLFCNNQCLPPIGGALEENQSSSVDVSAPDVQWLRPRIKPLASQSVRVRGATAGYMFVASGLQIRDSAVALHSANDAIW